MTSHVSALAAATLLTASIALFAEPASTAPFSGALAIKKAAASDVETVRWGGGGWGGRGWGGGWRGGWGGGGWRGAGWGLGAGILGGAIIGGALASPYYGYGYGYGSPYYGYGYGYGYNSCWGWVPVAWGGWARAWVC
jgi:hypothetical protein